MRKCIAISSGVVLVVLLVATSVFAANPVVNSFSFNETLKQTESCFTMTGWEGDPEFCDYPTDSGKFTIQAKMSMAGIDISKFTGDTKFVVQAGGLYFDGLLSDDWKYVPGKTSFNVSYIGRDTDYGNPVKYFTVKFTWNVRSLSVNISGVTPYYIAPIGADRYLWNPTANIADEDIAYIQLGDDLYVGFNLPYTGKVTTKTTVKTDKHTGIPKKTGTSNVSLKGKGIETTDDFRISEKRLLNLQKI